MAYEAGTAYIQVLPSLKGFQTQIEAELRGVDAEVKVPVKPEVDPTTKEKAEKDGESAGGSFADAFKARVEAALKSLPEVKLDADSSDADRKLAEIRAQLDELKDKRIGIDLSDAEAQAKIAELQAQLKALQSSDSRLSVQFDAAKAEAALAAFQADLKRTLAPDVAPQAEAAAGSWADAFKRKVSSAFEALPELKITPNSSPAEQAIARIRQALQALADKRIGVDINPSQALASVKSLQAELDRIAGRRINPAVTADTSEASSALKDIISDVAKLDGKSAKVNVDDGGSAENSAEKMGLLGRSLLALSPAAVPIVSTVIPAIAGIGQASMAAIAGVVALKMGLSGISDAYSAVKQAGITESQNAAQNAMQIRDAEQGVADARAQAANSAISSAEQVVTAQQSLADAERTTVEQVRAALQAQTQAEQQLADAQRQELQAQQALNDARLAATRNLEDLQMAATQAQLDQRQATLQLAEAQQSLASVQANPYAAPFQRAQAQMQYEQAQLALQRADVTQTRSGQDLGIAQQRGVEGSSSVMAAQGAAIQAQQGVGNAQFQAATAAQSLNDAQIESAEKLRAAQLAVSDAYRQQAMTAMQSTEQITRAQEALYQATHANQQEINAVNLAMSKLSPAGQEFVGFLRQIEPQFHAISMAAQQALIPGIQAGIQALLPILPTLRDLISSIAGAVGGLAKGLGQALASPQFQSLFSTLAQTIVPTLQTMGQLLGKLALGFGNLFVALIPLANAFGQSLLKVADHLIAWTQGAGFQQFIGFLEQALPVAGDLLSQIGDALMQLLVPVGKLGLALIQALVPIVEKLLPPLVKVVSAVGDALTRMVVSATPGLLKLADALGGFLTELATDFGPVLGQLGDLLGQVAGVVAGVLADALKQITPFLAPMAEEWGAIVSAAASLMPALIDIATQAIPPFLSLLPVLLPLFQSMADVFKDVLPPLADVVTTLVEALVPVIKDMIPIIKPMLDLLVQLFDMALRGAVVPLLKDWLIPNLQLTADVIKWLVQNVVDPMMRNYGYYFQGAWDVIKPIFTSINQALKDAGTQFGDATTIIKQAWEVLEKAVGTPVKAVIDFCYNDGLVPMWNQFAYLVSAPQLTKVSTAGIPHFAGGGVLPGYGPGNDIVPALLSPGEAVLVPEAVKALGVPTILALNAGFGGRPAVGNVARFASGGVVGNMLAMVGGGNSNITDPLGTVQKAVGANNPLVDIVSKLPTVMMNLAANYLMKQFTSLGGLLGGGGGASTAAGGQLDEWIAAAIAFAGVPASWASGLHTLIMRESGGNPRAINNYDINAQRGDPSRGLTQTIGATFNAYRDPRLSSDIYDPVSNIVAAIRYIIARYGDISRVQQANPNMPPMGYDSGGWLPPGLSTVANATGRPEAVLTAAQFTALTTQPSIPSDGWEISGDLTVDGMDARIDGRIQRANNGVGTAIAQRARV